MAFFRRFVFLLLAVTVIFSLSHSVVASAEELVDEFILVPYAEYGCEFLEDDNLSEFFFDDILPYIDFDLPLNLSIDGISFSANWVFVDDDGGYYYCGNPDWYLGFDSNGLPFHISTSRNGLYMSVRGELPHSRAYIEIYQGYREIIEFPPDPNDPTLGPGSIPDSSISTMLSYVLGWWTIFWNSFIAGPLSPLITLFAVGIAVPFIFFVVKLIRTYL